jgi:hypothetical protein
MCKHWEDLFCGEYRSFLVEFFRYKIMLSENRDSLASSFPIYIPFISSSCLISLARNCKTILNIVERMGTIVLFLTLEEMALAFPHLV